MFFGFIKTISIVGSVGIYYFFNCYIILKYFIKRIRNRLYNLIGLKIKSNYLIIYIWIKVVIIEIIGIHEIVIHHKIVLIIVSILSKILMIRMVIIIDCIVIKIVGILINIVHVILLIIRYELLLLLVILLLLLLQMLLLIYDVEVISIRLIGIHIVHSGHLLLLLLDLLLLLSLYASYVASC